MEHTEPGRSIAPTRLSPQPWMQDEPARAVLGALAAAGIAARFVGGCVRDALLGLAIGDIDLATPARPEKVTAVLQNAGIKVVPTGVAQGTVTAIVPPRHYEITTLRRDVATDGRHALVAFDAGWAEDAARRDFTMNAIYLDPDGTIHDPVGGLPDLMARRVRFVGDARRRIAEDVLRLLRYYRFEARFGEGQGDAEARAACREAAGLLPSLSAERVAHELIRLLQVADPVPALRMMQEDGVLAIILPEAARLDRLQHLIALEGRSDLAPDAILRLAALAEIGRDQAVALAQRLRLSNAMRDRLAGLASPWPLDPDPGERGQRQAIHRLGAGRYRDLVCLVAADNRIGQQRLASLLALAARWQAPAFPLAGRDVTALGIPAGPRVGRLLAEIQAWWEEGDFAADREACLARLASTARNQPAIK